MSANIIFHFDAIFLAYLYNTLEKSKKKKSFSGVFKGIYLTSSWIRHFFDLKKMILFLFLCENICLGSH